MRILIAVPALDFVNTDFFQSCISLQHVGEVQWTIARSSLVYTARNALADSAIDNGFDRVMWIDSDMVFAPDMLQRFSEDLDEGRDFVCGLYFKRKTPYKAVIYKEQKVIQHEDGLVTAVAPLFDEYPRDQIFEIAACGFGAVMTSVDLLRRVRDRFGQGFTPTLGFGEDLSFCARVSQLGVKMYCDSRIKVGHVGHIVIDEGLVDGESNNR